MKYYIGIDGGGTKTAFCAANSEDASLRYSKDSGASWREHGIPAVTQMLRMAVDELMLEDKDKIAGIAMGLPCYGESARGDAELEKAVSEIFAPVPVYLTNDVEVGWAGSLALEPGINIVAGTGSIGYGKDSQGKTARCGGWSDFFGDEGSCFWMGRKVMELFSKQADGRMKKDELYDIVYRELKLENDISFIDLMHTEYLGYRKKVAVLQFYAEKAALAGSVSAKALYNEACRELLLLVDAIKDKLVFTESPWKVSYSGGLFKAGELLMPQFMGEIEKLGGRVMAPRFEPVEGALLLAYQHFYPQGLNQIIKAMEEK